MEHTLDVEVSSGTLHGKLSNIRLYPHNSIGQQSRASYVVMNSNKKVRHQSRKKWPVPQES